MSDDSVSSNGTCATEMSFEVKDFSPPESPVDSQIEHEHGLPDPYRIDPLVGAARAETADDEDGSQWCSICWNGFAWCNMINRAQTSISLTAGQPASGVFKLTPRCLKSNMMKRRARARYLASFISWCWGYLGKHNRVVIPSCVVVRIHQEYPDEEGKYLCCETLPRQMFGREGSASLRHRNTLVH
uniref:P2X purinoreceptor 7 intracellular domain-containing protein n=1 Tax=Labrus bergylta TaxID=56723 RepID=A0A3Q3FWV4_9LABR